jgi:hypothetical protein
MNSDFENKLARCWPRAFDVAFYLQNRMPGELWLKFINIQQKEKLAGIIELIEAAEAKK